MTAEIRHWHKTRQAPEVGVVKTRRASTWDKLPQVAMDNVDNPAYQRQGMSTKTNGRRRTLAIKTTYS